MQSEKWLFYIYVNTSYFKMSSQRRLTRTVLFKVSTFRNKQNPIKMFIYFLICNLDVQI